MKRLGVMRVEVHGECSRMDRNGGDGESHTIFGNMCVGTFQGSHQLFLCLVHDIDGPGVEAKG